MALTMETLDNMNTHELPNNQVAMAAVLKETSKARAKLAKPIDAAALIMSGLRGHGWRVVPFPPLKTRNGKTKPKATVKAKVGRPKKLAA